MPQPANTRDGAFHCQNCLDDPAATADVSAEEVKDDGDVRAYNLACDTCGATGSVVVSLGFSPGFEIEDPFTDEW